MQINRNFAFERLVRSAVSGNSIGGIVGIVVLLALALFLISFGFRLPFVPLIVMGLIPLGGIALIIYRFRGDLKGSDYWIDQLVQEPHKIVWIKPVNIRHTAAYVITLYNEMHFQVLNRDGLATMIKCDSPENQVLFISGMKQYAPHAHIGFTEAISHHYRSGPQQFIAELQRNGLYNPVGAMHI
jgi:hypothetical protein